jgi:hypothetical protein
MRERSDTSDATHACSKTTLDTRVVASHKTGWQFVLILWMQMHEDSASDYIVQVQYSSVLNTGPPEQHSRSLGSPPSMDCGESSMATWPLYSSAIAMSNRACMLTFGNAPTHAVVVLLPYACTGTYYAVRCCQPEGCLLPIWPAQ